MERRVRTDYGRADGRVRSRSLILKVGEINAVRRDIQLAANSAWPPTDPASAATRRLFKIPARKPMVE